MSELIIQKDIIIDQLENVQNAIYTICKQRIDTETIKRFIINEQATKFYLDDKMNSSSNSDRNSVYLWLDTGMRDNKKQPVLICLHKTGHKYVGHYTETIRNLTNRIKSFCPRNAGTIEKNYSRFVDKYDKKVANRKHPYITQEKEYIIESIKEESEMTELAKQLMNLNLQFDTEEEKVFQEAAIDEKELEEELSENEQIITIGLLMDKIEDMEKYISELLEIISKNEKRSEKQINELQAKNKEYAKAILQMRNFVDIENETKRIKNNRDTMESGRHNGHELLSRNEKILVLGASDVPVNVMLAIAKQDFGFDKQDLEFETDYKKLVGISHRVHNSRRYGAVILGQCPHKVANLGNWSSVIEEFKNSGQIAYAVDARTKAGGLKVTKESYRLALYQVCDNLRKQNAD